MKSAMMLAAAIGVLIPSYAMAQAPPAVPLNPLAPANLAKPRPKAPFDLTGTWFIDMAGSQNSWRFGPPPPANKMTPETLKHFEAARATLLGWSFEPSRQDERAVASTLLHRVTFRLES